MSTTGIAISVTVIIVIVVRGAIGVFIAVVDAAGTGVGRVRGPRVVRRGSGVVVAVAVFEDLETLGQDAHVAELDLGTEGYDQVDDLRC